MTTSNIMNLMPQNNNEVQLVSEVNKIQGRSKSSDLGFASSEFSNILNGQKKESTSTNSDSSFSLSTDSGQEYSKYKYKDNSIKEGTTDSFKEKLEDNSDAISKTEDEIVEIVCDELNVSEEELVQVLETLGVLPIQLLDTQNLVNVTVEITGADDASMLLLDSNFQNLIQGMNDISSDLFNTLGVEQDNSVLKDIVSMMELLEQPIEGELSEGKAISVETDIVSDNARVINNEMAKNSVENEKTEVDVEADVIGNFEEDEKMIQVSNNNNSSLDKEFLDKNLEAEVATTDSTDEDNGGEQEGFSFKKNDFDPDGMDNSQVVSFNDKSNTIEVIQKVDSQTGVTSFVSVETREIISQIVDYARIEQNLDTTTMEMELNPENLGKIYLNISTKESTVNATITATNESVKEALEAQIVNLRDNLNQAGVKVDAIEVTVASHEFERNLEQNQSREEQQAMEQEKNNGRRRNISLSSLDELSGLMSEEESLVAQIMRENGNSVDYTA